MPAYGVLCLQTKDLTTYCSFTHFTRFFVPRWDMSVDEKVYTDTKKKACILQRMKELSSHSYSSCSRHLGCVLPPLLNISLDNIVLDELHLLLRIMDVLIRNLILYADGEDHRQKEHHGAESHNVRKLEQTIRSCGVCVRASRYGRTRSLMVSPYLETMTGLHSLASTSCLSSRSFPQRWTLSSGITFLHMLQSFGR